MISPLTEIERLVWYTFFSNLLLSAYIEIGEEMDAGNGLNNMPVVEPTLPLEALTNTARSCCCCTAIVILAERRLKNLLRLKKR